VRKRYYVLFVARDEEGELRKIHIPMHYLYVFLVGAVAGMFVVTGMAGSYGRMLMKVASFNQLRHEKDALKQEASKLEQVAREKEQQAASLSSLAGEVSQLYGLKSEPLFEAPASNEAGASKQEFTASLNRFYELRDTALRGTPNLFGLPHGETFGDWLSMSGMPSLWPVEGRVTGSFGERIDPFNGEGAFHNGMDISTGYGEPVRAAAAGTVVFADLMNGYGRVIILEHSRGVSTRYGHLSGFAVTDGQMVRRGDVIGYVGRSGRTTGPHLHYEVRINETPVNPYRYLKSTPYSSISEGSD
jgi:murein DD-endopeptidase MepM/ murein hydrolase activator NlpD